MIVDATQERYSIKPDYTARATPAYYEDRESAAVWQPDVYRLLRDLARSDCCREIVDVGCGRAGKLAALSPEFSIVGVDFGSNLEFCRSAYPWGRWISADLEQPFAREWFGDATAERRAIVCADVIEHLVNPRPLLQTLASLLTTVPFALLSTPERDLTHGADHHGPPPNWAHVREWNLSELRALLQANGLDVAFAGVTASQSRTFDLSTALVLLVRADSDASWRNALAAQCQARLRTYTAERVWLRTGYPSSGAAAEEEARAGVTTLPGLDSTRAIAPFGSTGAPVSIVIPTIAGLRSETVNNLLAQTWTDWEIVIPDNLERSPDLNAVAPDRVRTFDTRSQDAGAMTNAAVAVARGHFIAILDQSTMWDPIFLAACVAHLNSQNDSSVRGVLTGSTNPAVATNIDDVTVTSAMLGRMADMPASAVVFDREALSTVGGFHEGLGDLTAWELCLRFRHHFDLDALPLALVSRNDEEHRAGVDSTGAYTSPVERQRRQTHLLNALVRDSSAYASDARVVLEALSRHRVDATRERWRERSLEHERDQARNEVTHWRLSCARLHEQLCERLTRRLYQSRAGVTRVAILGTGDIAEILHRLLTRSGIDIVAAGDNNPARWNEPWHNIPLTAVDTTAHSPADIFIVASVSHAADLADQMRSVLLARGDTRHVVTLLD